MKTTKFNKIPILIISIFICFNSLNCFCLAPPSFEHDLFSTHFKDEWDKLTVKEELKTTLQEDVYKTVAEINKFISAFFKEYSLSLEYRGKKEYFYPKICHYTQYILREVLAKEFKHNIRIETKCYKWTFKSEIKFHYWLELILGRERFYVSITDGQFFKPARLMLLETMDNNTFKEEYFKLGLNRLVFRRIENIGAEYPCGAQIGKEKNVSWFPKNNDTNSAFLILVNALEKYYKDNENSGVFKNDCPSFEHSRKLIKIYKRKSKIEVSL